MFSDLILDGEMEDILLAAQGCIDNGKAYLAHMGHLSQDMAQSMILVRDDLAMMLACYEDGKRRRYAYPSVREELRRLEGMATVLANSPLQGDQNHVR
jgi:hypothetical protein